MADGKVAEVFAYLGFKTDQTKVIDFVHALGEVNLSSIVAAVGLGGLYETVKKIMDPAEELALSMNNFGEATGLNQQKMQKWSYGAQQMGADGLNMAQVLGDLQTRLTQMSMHLDPDMAKALFFLNGKGAGINGHEDPFTFIEKVSHGFDKLDPKLRTTVLGYLHWNDQMAVLLNHFGQFEDRSDAMPVMDQSQIDKLKNYHAEVSQLGQQWSNIFNGIAAGPLADILDGLYKITEGIMQTVSSSKALQLILWTIAGNLVVLGLSNPFTFWPTLLTLIIAGLGEIAHNWDHISSSIMNAWNALKGFGKALNIFHGIKFGNSPTDYVSPNAPNLSTGHSTVHQMIAPVFHISGQDAKDIAEHVHRKFQDILSDAAYNKAAMMR